MGWRFWRRRSSTEVEAAEQQAHDDDAAAEAGDDDIEELALDELDADVLEEPAPRISKFTFERPPIPAGVDTEVVHSMPAAAEEPPHVRVERVVRSKAAGRRSGTDLRARGVGPVWVPGLLEIATSYRLAAEARVDDPAGAREFWNAYLELCPEDAEAWFAFGQLLLGERRFEQAWTSFEAAHRHDPGNGLAAGALGFLSTVRGDHVAAATWYTTAVKLRPGCRDMLGSLADAQDAAGRTADAARTRAELERLQAED